MDEKLLRYTLRADRIIFQKFRYVAEADGRSANKAIVQCMKQCIENYEGTHGKIEVKGKKD